MICKIVKFLKFLKSKQKSLLAIPFNPVVFITIDTKNRSIFIVEKASVRNLLHVAVRTSGNANRKKLTGCLPEHKLHLH